MNEKFALRGLRSIDTYETGCDIDLEERPLPSRHLTEAGEVQQNQDALIQAELEYADIALWDHPELFNLPHEDPVHASGAQPLTSDDITSYFLHSLNFSGVSHSLCWYGSCYSPKS